MASINQGDDAVERLDNAVTAFEQIMTGQEGQTVAVPGHQPQPTLAERVKQNLKPSTDEAAGYAAQASVSAKAADDAAKRASQISGLETVADAIGMVALPLPDVWAPLSDSLRLITGYGRDVLVGSDVVARMVNFSRSTTKTYRWKDGSLKTAAVNEPAFELEGLLPDGQSTNLFPWSQEFIGKWSRVDGVASPDANFPNAILLTDSSAGYVHTSPGNLTVGSPYAILAIVKGYVEGSTELKGVFANDPQDSGKVVGRYGPYTVLSFVRNAALNTNPIVTGLMWAPGKATGIVLCAMQVEALPFSSSYIPTSGAAVTRAADLLSLPQAGNFQDSDFTVAIEVKRNTTIPHSVYPKLLQFGPDLWVVASSERVSAKISADNEYCSVIKPAPGSYETIVLRQKGGEMSLLVTGAAINKVSRTGRKSTLSPVIGLGSTGSGFDALFGNIRNLRVWHRALSDEQMRAIK